VDELVGLAETLQTRCGKAGLRVATAESCTGGMVAAAITAVPGSSTYFEGGVVAYGDRAKHELLGVDEGLIASHGAVSAQVALAMARGGRTRFGADLAVAVTGIAGPGGGSEEKPVGLTYVAVVGPGGEHVQRFAWSGSRGDNQRLSARAALELLLEAASASEAPA
jgi:PncC family amidohydrolase